VFKLEVVAKEDAEERIWWYYKLPQMTM